MGTETYWTSMQLSFIYLLIFFASSIEAGSRYPVILVPGDGGSQLVVKLNKTSAPHYYCAKKTSDYESIWLNLEELVPGAIDCFVDNMRLRYDNVTRTTSNGEGVDIKTQDFGGTSSIEWLDGDSWTHISSSLQYFYPIVRDLVKIGYVRGKSVRGAPFDFRRAPNELGVFFGQFKSLIEDTFQINNNSRVILVAHSMGNPVTLYFLNQQPQIWKDKYIQGFVTLAGVWAGAVKTIRLMASGDGVRIKLGDTLGVVLVNALKVRPEQRAMPSTAFLMPSDKYWKASEVLVQTEHRNYTVADYKQFFVDINFTTGWEMRVDTQDLIKDITAPGVAVHCMHGIGLDTPAGFIFPKGGFPDTYPTTIPGNGDGTVNIRSLLACLNWTKEQSQPVNHVPIKGAEHMAILGDPTVSKYILKLATGGT